MAEVDAALSGTVKLPGIGPVKKVYVYVGVGAVGVLAAYIMWRRNNAEEEVEPSEADLGTGLTTGAGSDVYSGATAGGSGSVQEGEDIPTTNTEWTQRVIEYFSWLEPGYVANTVGKYLAKQGLTAEEGDFIRQAWAVLGKPPEGPSTFTLSSGTNTPGTTPDPSVPTGLKVASVTQSSISLDWNDASDTTGYQVLRNGSVVGTPSGSSYTDTGLASGTSYSYTVKSTSGSKTSGASSAVAGKTTAATTTPGKPTTPTKPKPPAPQYHTVTVVKYRDNNPPWNSTISGIAAHYGYGSNWQTVWNDSKNFGLRSKRKDPKKIQAGDKVYVKKK
jgi:hypothetical protein